MKSPPSKKTRDEGPRISEATRRALRRDLLAWFSRHARDLPWRRTSDPYAVFLSEIMLQQTRVETVIPYFERFLSRYPTVTALASAPIDDVLTEWSGLGYYRRARSLWHAAREVVARYGGELPQAREDLESLPGIGPYTAGAIASVAYGREEALVDGNVSRVLARIFEIADPVDSPQALAAFWSLARELVRGERPGYLNQALMELGAVVCIPGKPRCSACPVAAHCGAKRNGKESELPTPKRKRVSPTSRFDAIVMTSGAHVVLAKRPATGLFAGLWEPPLFESIRTGSASDRAPLDRRRARSLALPVGLSADRGLSGRDAGTFRHVLTHRVMEVRVIVQALRKKGALPALTPPYVELAWFECDDIAALRPSVALSRLARRSLEAAGVIEKRGKRGETVRSR